MHDEFLYKEVPSLGRRVFRLGLATNYGVEAGDVAWALDQGINYFFWTSRANKVLPALKKAIQRDRESLIIATGPTTGYFGGGIKRGCDRLLKKLGTDYIDILQIFWLGRTAAWTPSTIDALVSLKESGKVRAIGISIHDRKRAGRLAADSSLDILMVRYNAAHTGAEKDVFPQLAKRQPAIVCYTATRWRGLLKRPKGWEGPVMTAADCYRFCLSSPHVHVVLTGPRNRQQLDENLAAVAEGPLTAEEEQWVREYGRLVKARKKLPYI